MEEKQIHNIARCVKPAHLGAKNRGRTSSYRLLFGFHDENKNDFNKKAKSTTTMTAERFKCYKNSTLFDAQNAGGGGGHAASPP